MSLKPEEITLFKLVIKDLIISVKNGTLYDFEHPIYMLSIQKLKNSLDDWFKVQKQFILGFSQRRILMNSELIESKEEYLFEMAKMMHAKGILSFDLNKTVTVSELAKFVCELRKEVQGPDAQIDQEKEDWAADYPNISVKELDYRLLLTSQSSEYTTEEEEIWVQLLRSDRKFDETMSDENIETMLRFFDAPGESASFLNRVYKEALKKDTNEQIVESFQQAIFGICDYFQKHSKSAEQKQFKINLATIISRLHPDLIEQLFENTVIQGKNFDLAQELINDFSNQDIAEFLQSLIQQDGSMNEYLLKIFQKMVPGEDEATAVAPLVANELLNKHILNPNSFKQIQLSIKELFKNQPENHFLNEMYKITVDALSDTDTSNLKFTVKMGPFVNQFVKTYEEEFFREERVWILLKILAQEENTIDFQKYGEKFLLLFREMLEKEDISLISKSLSFYKAKIVPQNSGTGSPLDREKNALINRIMNEANLKVLLELIPKATEEELEHLSHILMLTKAMAAPMIVDTYLKAKGPMVREKLLVIIANMKSVINAEALKRVSKARPKEVRELFRILKICDPDKLNLAARKILNQKNATLLWDALEFFVPRSEDDVDQLMKLAIKHNSPEIQKKAAIAILNSKNTQFAEILFNGIQGNFFQKSRMEDLVVWCREVKAESAYPELYKVFERKPNLFSKSSEKLRIDAFNTMACINPYKASDSLNSLKLAAEDPFYKKCFSMLQKYQGN
jgi:hypothetical protein